MDCKYILIRSIHSGDIGDHVGFGIAAVDSDWGTVSAAYDLSTDENKVADLVKKCNGLKLSPAHFQDVVEDFLS